MREGDKLHSRNNKVLFSLDNNLFEHKTPESIFLISDLQYLLHPIVRLNWSPRGNPCLRLSGCQHQPMRGPCQGSLTNQSSPKSGLRGVIWVWCEWTVRLSVSGRVSSELWESGLHPAWLPRLSLVPTGMSRLLIGQATLRCITHSFSGGFWWII